MIEIRDGHFIMPRLVGQDRLTAPNAGKNQSPAEKGASQE